MGNKEDEGIGRVWCINKGEREREREREIDR